MGVVSGRHSTDRILGVAALLLAGCTAQPLTLPGRGQETPGCERPWCFVDFDPERAACAPDLRGSCVEVQGPFQSDDSPSSRTTCWSNGVKEQVTFGPPGAPESASGTVTKRDGHTICYFWTSTEVHEPPSTAWGRVSYRDATGAPVGTITNLRDGVVLTCPDGESRTWGLACITPVGIISPIGVNPPTCTTGACKL
jgi:hypothetical protein